MPRFLLRRLLHTLFVVWGVVTVVFFLGLFPGSCLYGLGLPVTWLAYHGMLLRFLVFARNRIRRGA